MSTLVIAIAWKEYKYGFWLLPILQKHVKGTGLSNSFDLVSEPVIGRAKALGNTFMLDYL